MGVQHLQAHPVGALQRRLRNSEFGLAPGEFDRPDEQTVSQFDQPGQVVPQHCEVLGDAAAKHLPKSVFAETVRKGCLDIGVHQRFEHLADLPVRSDDIGHIRRDSRVDVGLGVDKRHAPTFSVSRSRSFRRVDISDQTP